MLQQPTSGGVAPENFSEGASPEIILISEILISLGKVIRESRFAGSRQRKIVGDRYFVIRTYKVGLKKLCLFAVTIYASKDMEDER